jgi:hypothetical protein
MYTFNFLREVIHGDKFRVAAADVIIDGEPTYVQAEFLLNNNAVIFCKTDYLFMLFEILLHSPKKYILITHNSDFTIGKGNFDIRPKSIIKWYALNVGMKDAHLIPIPSGMERPLGGGYSSDATVLAERLKQPREFQNLVYMNHNANNNHGARDFITMHLKDQPWVTWRPHGQSFESFIANCYSHKFVVSPPGNGIDCHRTWEALYMGAIPIVKRSILTQSFSDLPMLIVEDWSVITEELLNIVWDEFQTRTFNYEKLTLSYWLNRIVKDKLELLEGEE